MKKLLFTVLFVSVSIFFSNVYAFQGEDLNLIEPALDLDFVILRSNQSTTVTADLGSPLDFEIIPVALIGSGNVSASITRTNTRGEVIYIMLYGFGIKDGNENYDVNVGVTPATFRVSAAVEDGDNWHLGLIIHGMLFSTETPPYSYNVSLSF